MTTRISPEKHEDRLTQAPEKPKFKQWVRFHAIDRKLAKMDDRQLAGEIRQRTEKIQGLQRELGTLRAEKARRIDIALP